MADIKPLKKTYKSEYQKLRPRDKCAFGTEIFGLLVQHDPEAKYSKHIADLIKKLGVTPTVVYRMAKSQNFKEIWNSLLDARNKELENQALKETHDGIKRDVPFAKLISEIKDFSWLMVKTSRTLAETHARMIEYYAKKIADKINACGGVEQLKKEDTDEIELLENNMKHYTRGIAEFLKPSGVSNYLKMVGIESAIVAGMEEIDQSAFTMARLQAVFTEVMGEVPILGDKAKIDESFAAYKEIMPDIKASR